jgi:hypothetical protein
MTSGCSKLSKMNSTLVKLFDRNPLLKKLAMLLMFLSFGKSGSWYLPQLSYGRCWQNYENSTMPYIELLRVLKSELILVEGKMVWLVRIWAVS